MLCLVSGVPAHAEADRPALSLLALGDTGKLTSWPETWMPQYRVGEAMAREDRRAPVHALLFLGDNFYPKGLSRHNFRDRLRENLAGPYCHFLMLTTKGRHAAREACDRAPEETHPVPILAVTGNHDVERGQGVTLQRERLPAFVGNWLMPADARSYELGSGLSVIAFHSQPIMEGADASALERALRASEGPWRIVIAHHPIVDPGGGWKPEYAARVLAAIEAAGKPVHLFLGGHQHSLEALRGPGAALHVVSGGGGAQIRALSPTSAERLFGEASYGFARVDLRGEGEGALEVTLLGLSGPFDRDAEPMAKFRVSLDGAVEALSAPPAAGRAAGRAPAHR